MEVLSWSSRERVERTVVLNKALLLEVLRAAWEEGDASGSDVYARVARRYARHTGYVPSKTEVVSGYRALVAEGALPFDREFLRRLQRKPVRTSSGVAPVTVLTKPYPCPGKCIFCPTFINMPKSYVPDEPGAQRALQNEFDPYRQTLSRIRAFEAIGHDASKVELLILGGTWSAYPRDYQEWFIKRCFDAMNGVEAASLEEAQRLNETAPHRNVGLVIETRPDAISPREIVRLRRLGVTKVQLGLQSLDDRILALNKRGHTVEDTRRAIRLLRAAGFKIVVHWMANLYGATPASDYEDFLRLWKDPAFRPDELKIYPTSLLENTELYQYWLEGKYQPYEEQVLVDLIARCKTQVPRYCRINRVFRDIPTPHIVAGNKKTNLRQLVHAYMAERGMQCQCIRCREIRHQRVDPATLRLDVLTYETDVTREYFLSFVTPENRIAGFLRLALPQTPDVVPVEEIRHAAMIREVHVYGPALPLGTDGEGEAQHSGLGRRLIAQAMAIAREAGYREIGVIAAIGTRNYYRRLGFELRELYMVRSL